MQTPKNPLQNIIKFRQQLSAVIDPGLGRISQAIKPLIPKISKIKCISIAGTNGKGSVGKIITQLLKSANKTTAWFNSPHLFCYNERFQINGDNASDDALFASFLQCKNVALAHKLTIFEFDFLLALTLFVQQQPDFIILEVGMGGRLDAVNAVDTDLAIITAIALDHQDFLGDNITDIGLEKAAIMRANKPAIIGDIATKSVVQYGNKINANMFLLGKDFTLEVQNNNWQYNCCSTEFTSQHNLPIPNLLPYNWALALAAINVLKVPIKNADLQPLMQLVSLAGRFDLLTSNPADKYFVICDVAANEQAIANLATNLQAFCKNHKVQKIYAMVGFLKGKAKANTLDAFANFNVDWSVVSVVCDEFPTRSETAQNTNQQLNLKNASLYNDVSLAFDAIKPKLQAKDLLLCFGSFYMLADFYATYK